MSENQSGGLSRRDLLKKGAVAGGIVWTAPLIMSATDVAGASSPFVCTTYYFAKWNLQAGTFGACESGIGAQDCSNVAGRAYEDGCPTTYGPPTAIPGGYEVYIDARLGKSPTGALIQNVSGVTKGGNKPTGSPCGTGGATYVAPNPTYPRGAWRVTFPGNAPNGTGLSHAEVTWCV